MQIIKIEMLPDDFPDLLSDSLGEGYLHIQRMKQEWDAGFNRFSNPGEALYIAQAGERCAGICGLNRQAIDDGIATARLRRLYVRPEYRRQGIGRQLVERALRDACVHFQQVDLRTMTAPAATFFESMGFQRVAGSETITHSIELAEFSKVNSKSGSARR